MNYLYAALIGYAATYALWVLYLAIMNLKRAKDAGLLSLNSKIHGYPLLALGYVLDCFVNFTVMTLVLLEIPQELTVTARLKRHNNESTGWRKAVAVWAEPMLDPYDPSGDHI